MFITINTQNDFINLRSGKYDVVGDNQLIFKVEKTADTIILMESHDYDNESAINILKIDIDSIKNGSAIADFRSRMNAFPMVLKEAKPVLTRFNWGGFIPNDDCVIIVYAIMSEYRGVRSVQIDYKIYGQPLPIGATPVCTVNITKKQVLYGKKTAGVTMEYINCLLENAYQDAL